MFTDEPAVLTWMVALAPQPARPPIGRHWWRELVHEAWLLADHSWQLQREAVASGYATEEREYAEVHPRPLLKDFLVHLSTGKWSPEAVL